MATRIAEPGYVVQRATRINGVQYDPGDPAPPAAEIGNAKRLVRIGILAPAPAVVVASMPLQADTWDPASGTVEEALRFVMAHPDQLDRVREAEEAGQGRVTLLEALDEGLPEPQGPRPRLPVSPDPYTPSTSLAAVYAAMGEGSVDAVVEPDSPEDLEPADHPVPVVIGWVDTRPEAAGVVLERERTGKNRTTLVTHLERLVEAQGTSDGGE